MHQWHVRKKPKKNMTYNGIGLQTTRGSGTNGYVQRNLSYVRASKKPIVMQQEFKAPEIRKSVFLVSILYVVIRTAKIYLDY